MHCLTTSPSPPLPPPQLTIQPPHHRLRSLQSIHPPPMDRHTRIWSGSLVPFPMGALTNNTDLFQLLPPLPLLPQSILTHPFAMTVTNPSPGLKPPSPPSVKSTIPTTFDAMAAKSHWSVSPSLPTKTFPTVRSASTKPSYCPNVLSVMSPLRASVSTRSRSTGILTTSFALSVVGISVQVKDSSRKTVRPTARKTTTTCLLPSVLPVTNPSWTKSSRHSERTSMLPALCALNPDASSNSSSRVISLTMAVSPTARHTTMPCVDPCVPVVRNPLLDVA